MKIDLSGENIVIEDNTEKLGPIEKSQISFWGFLCSNNDNIYRCTNTEEVFLKIIRYFEKEQLNFELKQNALEYSRQIQLVQGKFNSLKSEAEKFKNGDFEKAQFDEFRDFVSGNIKRNLKIHQLKAAYHLYLLGNAANFSVPGSGKTTVVLTVYEKLRLEGKVNTIFVVGPPSSFGPWRNEFTETLGRKPKFTVLAGADKRERKRKYINIPDTTSELYLTSFHTSLYDKSDMTSFLKQKHIKAFFVVDEAHYIKQLNGSWAQAILDQSMSAAFRCILTGTPMPKSYTDVFNLFDFLWPKEKPIGSSDRTKIKLCEETRDAKTAKELLDRLIGPLFYRVRKSDLNLKPQNFIEPVLIKMAINEKKIYDAIFNRIKNYSKEEYLKNIEFINTLGRGRIIRLRQAVSYPKLLTSAIDNYDEMLLNDLDDIKYLISNYDKIEIPQKLFNLIELVKGFQAKKLKVVIWSNFIGTINLIEKQLKKIDINCKKIYGDTPVEDGTNKENTRERIRDEFIEVNSGLDVLIANPAACAESISLHKTCHNAVYYDLSYNCAQFLQSLDRIHRVGASELIEANYYFLQYENTIDIDIKSNIDTKTNKMLEIIEEDYPIYSLDMWETEGDGEAYKRLFLQKNI